MSNPKDLCPCCSGKSYESCCKPFHDGYLPENAVQLMRSRYSAYFFNIPNYIIATTHPASSRYSENKFSWKRNISQFARNSTFHKLEILDFKERGDLATVTFTAFISQEGKDVTYTERSYFEKKNKCWLYRGGQITEGHAPNFVTTGQLRLLPLAYYGEPILRRKADPVIEITDDLRTLVEEMIETMDACDGIGLAAPQVHHSIRLFVMQTQSNTEERGNDSGGIEVIINPILSEPSVETWKAPEGCLSIPTFRFLIERHKEITVEYTTLDGSQIKKRVSGWQARVFQHETDHIDGILFIDRLDPEEQSQLLPHLQSLERRIHDGRAL